MSFTSIAYVSDPDAFFSSSSSFRLPHCRPFRFYSEILLISMSIKNESYIYRIQTNGPSPGPVFTSHRKCIGRVEITWAYKQKICHPDKFIGNYRPQITNKVIILKESNTNGRCFFFYHFRVIENLFPILIRLLNSDSRGICNFIVLVEDEFHLVFSHTTEHKHDKNRWWKFSWWF